MSAINVLCSNCGFERSVLHGPGMLGIEMVPSVCYTCVEIVSLQRVWEPLRDDPSHCTFLRRSTASEKTSNCFAQTAPRFLLNSISRTTTPLAHSVPKLRAHRVATISKASRTGCSGTSGGAKRARHHH